MGCTGEVGRNMLISAQSTVLVWISHHSDKNPLAVSKRWKRRYHTLSNHKKLEWKATRSLKIEPKEVWVRIQEDIHGNSKRLSGIMYTRRLSGKLSKTLMRPTNLMLIWIIFKEKSRMNQEPSRPGFKNSNTISSIKDRNTTYSSTRLQKWSYWSWCYQTRRWIFHPRKNPGMNLWNQLLTCKLPRSLMNMP